MYSSLLFRRFKDDFVEVNAAVYDPVVVDVVVVIRYPAFCTNFFFQLPYPTSGFSLSIEKSPVSVGYGRLLDSVRNQPRCVEREYLPGEATSRPAGGYLPRLGSVRPRRFPNCDGSMES